MINKLKTFPLKTVLLTLFAWALFWEIKETITGERMIFMARWLYSDIGHAKNIEVRSYLLTDEQVRDMLSYPNEDIQQPSKKQISSKNMNVVLRIRNLTGGLAWGRLSWTLPYTQWHIVDVPDIPVPEKGRKYADIIIPIGIIPMGRADSPPEPITVKWDEFYVYR